MNTSLNTLTVFIFATQAGVVAFLFFSIVILIKLFRKRLVGRKLKVGIVLSLLVWVFSFSYLANQDWTVPECYDDQGMLLADEPRCEYP